MSNAAVEEAGTKSVITAVEVEKKHPVRRCAPATAPELETMFRLALHIPLVKPVTVEDTDTSVEVEAPMLTFPGFQVVVVATTPKSGAFLDAEPTLIPAWKVSRLRWSSPDEEPSVGFTVTSTGVAGRKRTTTTRSTANAENPADSLFNIFFCCFLFDLGFFR